VLNENAFTSNGIWFASTTWVGKKLNIKDSANTLIEKVARRIVIPMLPRPMRLPLSFKVATQIANYEAEVLALRRLLPNLRGLALDVGANVGFWTYALKRTNYFDAIVALEPNPSMAQQIADARLEAVRVECCAVSDTIGEAMLRIPIASGVAMAGWATLERQIDCLHDTVTSIAVRTKTIDSMGLENLRFVKLDVEGHELAALRGGTRTLTAFKPVCIIEVRRENLAGVDEWFSTIDLRYKRVNTLSDLGVDLSGDNVMYRFE
jgi:FkbM family methyltransferase